MRHLESKLQQSCVRWFRLQYSSVKELLFAVPNGGARGKIEASIMKSEGVTAGVADLILLIPRKGYGSLCIEMKTDKGTQRDTQKVWQEQAERHGNKYVICRSLEDFMTQITEYLH